MSYYYQQPVATVVPGGYAIQPQGTGPVAAYATGGQPVVAATTGPAVQYVTAGSQYYQQPYQQPVYQQAVYQQPAYQQPVQYVQQYPSAVASYSYPAAGYAQQAPVTVIQAPPYGAGAGYATAGAYGYAYPPTYAYEQRPLW